MRSRIPSTTFVAFVAIVSMTAVITMQGQPASAAAGSNPPRASWRTAPVVTPAGPVSCLDVPVSPSVLKPSSCWVTGPTSIVVAGTDARSPDDGVVAIVQEQHKRVITFHGAGRLHIEKAVDAGLCVSAADGSEYDIISANGGVVPGCAATPPSASATDSLLKADSSLLTSAPPPPAPSSSFYVYGSYVDQCGPTATTGCPLYNSAANAPVPSTGGMTILAFGAPCFEPSTLAWGTQMFNSQSCTPDSEIAVLTQAFIRGYETNPNRSTSTPFIVAAGTSNSLTAAVPSFALTASQMQAHGQAWSSSVVSPVAAAVAGLAAPITVWGASDIEEASDGNWYAGAPSRSWVDGFAAASGTGKPCQAGANGLMADFGDYVPNEPGWSNGDVYHVAWQAAASCPVPEIYFTANATEWKNLNQWAINNGLSAMQFTGVLSENGSGGSLSASGSWTALQTATGQSAPYLSVIGAIVGQAQHAPDAPTGVTAVAGGGSATISWSAPAWDGGSRVTAYTVAASTGGSVAKSVTLSGWPVPETTVMNDLANGTAYTFTVTATNAIGTSGQSSPSSAVMPSETLPFTAASTAQYHLTGSNGSTWVELDATRLAINIQPSADAQAVVTANTALFTNAIGINQDLGVTVNGTLAAWKESGGAAILAPNEAAVQTVIPVHAGTSYRFALVWKSNKPAGASTIYAGAGATPGQYSPTRITAQLVQTAANLGTASITTQPKLSNSNGSTWTDIDPQNLSLAFTAPATGSVIVSGNADLWTGTAGYNQDLGVAVNGAIAAWKESGGRAGAGSPNAALVRAVVPVTSGSQYTFSLRWKTNRPAPGVSIYAGAGPLAGAFSPTRLMLRFVGSSITSSVTTNQYSMKSSDGSTWTPIDSTKLALPQSGNCDAVFSVSADLWTTVAGYNQDVAIDITPIDGVAYPGGIVAWGESGGGAAGSPDAMYVESVIGLPAGHSYTVTVLWKSNRPAGTASIVAGAGAGSPFSPTSLAAEVTCS